MRGPLYVCALLKRVHWVAPSRDRVPNFAAPRPSSRRGLRAPGQSPGMSGAALMTGRREDDFPIVPSQTCRSRSSPDV